MKQAKKQLPVAKEISFQDADTAISGIDNDVDMEFQYNEIDKLEQHGINMADI